MRKREIVSQLTAFLIVMGGSGALLPSLALAQGPRSASSGQTSGRTSAHKITGRITDSDGEPLIGAGVVDVKSRQGVITNLDGNGIEELITEKEELNLQYSLNS